MDQYHTSHVEAVQVYYDTEATSYEELLEAQGGLQSVADDWSLDGRYTFYYPIPVAQKYVES